LDPETDKTAAEAATLAETSAFQKAAAEAEWKPEQNPVD
jgi:hypothetical protein